MQFSVAARGEGAVGYQWRMNGVDLADGPQVQGATSATLMLSNVLASQAGAYAVVVRSDVASVTSRSASLAVSSVSDVIDAPYLDVTVLGAPWSASSGAIYVPGATNGGARLYVSEAPRIINHPSSQAGIAGEDITFSVDIAGSAPFTYQWRFNGLNLTDGGGISGVRSSNLCGHTGDKMIRR